MLALLPPVLAYEVDRAGVTAEREDTALPCVPVNLLAQEALAGSPADTSSGGSQCQQDSGSVITVARTCMHPPSQQGCLRTCTSLSALSSSRTRGVMRPADTMAALQSAPFAAKVAVASAARICNRNKQALWWEFAGRQRGGGYNCNQGRSHMCWVEPGFKISSDVPKPVVQHRSSAA